MRVGHDSAHVERHALNRQVKATKCEYTPVKRDSINTNTANRTMWRARIKKRTATGRPPQPGPKPPNTPT